MDFTDLQMSPYFTTVAIIAVLVVFAWLRATKGDPSPGHANRIYLRFKNLGVVCEFLRDGTTCAQFDGKNYWFNSIFIGPYYLQVHPNMMGLSAGISRSDPLGTKTLKASRYDERTGILEIDLGTRVFQFHHHDEAGRRRIGSSITLDGERIACFWVPKSFFASRRFLELEPKADLANWEIVLLAFFSNYLPSAMKEKAA